MITPGAQGALDESGESPARFLGRHFSGDWGTIDAEDAKVNQDGLKNKGMVMSVYNTSKGTKIWVITDPGHEVTTLLLPEEY